ncbi:MAG: hypothetical protein EXX96DRAFT_625084 [Benjaminiella poitrasii]|nr:MAG: hypothetical protein EXX96DRAFT_625084 [Benjaminiella poitrasii]
MCFLETGKDIINPSKLFINSRRIIERVHDRFSSNNFRIKTVYSSKNFSDGGERLIKFNLKCESDKEYIVLKPETHDVRWIFKYSYGKMVAFGLFNMNVIAQLILEFATIAFLMSPFNKKRPIQQASKTINGKAKHSVTLCSADEDNVHDKRDIRVALQNYFSNESFVIQCDEIYSIHKKIKEKKHMLDRNILDYVKLWLEKLKNNDGCFTFASDSFYSDFTFGLVST